MKLDTSRSAWRRVPSKTQDAFKYLDTDGPEFSYLGHFRRPEFLEEGHNQRRGRRPTPVAAPVAAPKPSPAVLAARRERREAVQGARQAGRAAIAAAPRGGERKAARKAARRNVRATRRAGTAAVREARRGARDATSEEVLGPEDLGPEESVAGEFDGSGGGPGESPVINIFEATPFEGPTAADLANDRREREAHDRRVADEARLRARNERITAQRQAELDRGLASTFDPNRRVTDLV